MAGTLYLLGATTGSGELLEASPGQEAVTNRHISTLHDRFLEHYGGDWANPWLPPNWLEGDAGEEAVAAMQYVLESEVLDQEDKLLEIADPKLCLFSGLWALAIHALNDKPEPTVIPKLIFINRPIEQIVDEIHSEASGRLTRGQCHWLAGFYLSCRATWKSLFSTYVDVELEEMFEKATYERISEELGVEWPIPLNDVWDDIQEWMAPYKARTA